MLLVIKKYRPVAWLLFLTASLFFFIAWMPSQMRIIIWHALVARGILSGMLLVFSLLAVSLVWSVGQRVDVWAFLFFNLRGSRPVWLDWIMLGFTQIGSALAALAIGLILYLASDHLVAYEFILGSITLWMMVELVKALVRRSRPIYRVTQARIVGYRAIGRSFPSGHTSQAFFMVTLLAPYFRANAWVGILLYAIALLSGPYAHVCRCSLPTRCAGGSYPGLRLGAFGSARERISTERYRVGGDGWVGSARVFIHGCFLA